MNRPASQKIRREVTAIAIHTPAGWLQLSWDEFDQTGSKWTKTGKPANMEAHLLMDFIALFIVDDKHSYKLPYFRRAAR